MLALLGLLGLVGFSVGMAGSAGADDEVDQPEDEPGAVDLDDLPPQELPDDEGGDEQDDQLEEPDPEEEEPEPEPQDPEPEPEPDDGEKEPEPEPEPEVEPNLEGTKGNDQLQGTTGDDTIYAQDGDDDVAGGAGDDVIYLGDGNDFAGAPYEDDGYAAAPSLGDDTIYGGAGNDDIQDHQGSNALYGGSGDDNIDSRDFEAGSKAPDLVYGGDGDDYIVADMGDTLSGGAGTDSFEVDGSYAVYDQPVTITDYDPATETLHITVDDDQFGYVSTSDLEATIDAANKVVTLSVNGVALVKLQNLTEFDMQNVTLGYLA